MNTLTQVSRRIVDFCKTFGLEVALTTRSARHGKLVLDGAVSTIIACDNWVTLSTSNGGKYREARGVAPEVSILPSAFLINYLLPEDPGLDIQIKDSELVVIASYAKIRYPITTLLKEASRTKRQEIINAYMTLQDQPRRDALTKLSLHWTSLGIVNELREEIILTRTGCIVDFRDGHYTLVGGASTMEEHLTRRVEKLNSPLLQEYLRELNAVLSLPSKWVAPSPLKRARSKRTAAPLSTSLNLV